MPQSIADYLNSIMARMHSGEDACINALLSGNADAAMKEALSLHKHRPQYLLFVAYVSGPAQWPLFVRAIQQSAHADPFLLLKLCKDSHSTSPDMPSTDKKSISTDILRSLLSKALGGAPSSSPKAVATAVPKDGSSVPSNPENHINKRCVTAADALTVIDKQLESQASFIILSLCMQLLLLIEPAEVANELRHTHAHVVRAITKRLEDARLYKYAHDCNIEVVQNIESATVNGLWATSLYGARAKEAAPLLISKMRAIPDIARFIQAQPQIAQDACAATPVHTLLHRYLAGDDLAALYKEVSAIDTRTPLYYKLLLGILVATKDPANLLLALWITTEVRIPGDYEIQAVHLFLMRYFLLVPSVIQEFKALSVKNIQLYNMAYIWSDPLIKLTEHSAGDTSRRDLWRHTTVSAAVNELQHQHKSDLQTMRQYLRQFLDAERVCHAAELFKTRAAVADAVTVWETKHRRFRETGEADGGGVSRTSHSIFHGLLGAPADWLFEKAVPALPQPSASALPDARPAFCFAAPRTGTAVSQIPAAFLERFAVLRAEVGLPPAIS